MPTWRRSRRRGGRLTRRAPRRRGRRPTLRKQRFKRRTINRSRRSSKKGLRVAPNTAPWRVVTHKIEGIYRGAGTLDNATSFFIGRIIGHDHWYYRVLSSKGQSDDGALGPDATYAHGTFNPEGFAAITDWINTGTVPYGGTVALNNSFYFKEIYQTVTIRNMDLNPVYVTAYTCCLRKAFPNDNQQQVAYLTRLLHASMWSIKNETKDALDAATIGAGGLFEAFPTAGYMQDYQGIMSQDKNLSIYKFRDLMEHVFVMKRKTYIIGPGQITKLKLAIKPHFRTGLECFDEVWNIDRISDSRPEYENLQARMYLNTIRKGIKAKFFLFKITGFIGSRTVEGVESYGRIAPNLAFEWKEHTAILPTIQTHQRYDMYSTVGTGPFTGPSEFVTQA